MSGFHDSFIFTSDIYLILYFSVMRKSYNLSVKCHADDRHDRFCVRCKMNGWSVRIFVDFDMLWRTQAHVWISHPSGLSYGRLLCVERQSSAGTQTGLIRELPSPPHILTDPNKLSESSELEFSLNVLHLNSFFVFALGYFEFQFHTGVSLPLFCNNQQCNFVTLRYMLEEVAC